MKEVGKLRLRSVYFSQCHFRNKGITIYCKGTIKKTSNIKNVLKDKAVPLQVESGPEGSRNLRFQDYMTTAQDGGKVVSPTHRPPLPPGNAPGTHFR